MACNLEYILPPKVWTFAFCLFVFRNGSCLETFLPCFHWRTYQLILRDSNKSTIMTGSVEKHKGFGFSKILVDENFVSWSWLSLSLLPVIMQKQRESKTELHCSPFLMLFTLQFRFIFNHFRWFKIVSRHFCIQIDEVLKAWCIFSNVFFHRVTSLNSEFFHYCFHI